MPVSKNIKTSAQLQSALRRSRSLEAAVRKNARSIAKTNANANLFKKELRKLNSARTYARRWILTMKRRKRRV